MAQRNTLWITVFALGSVVVPASAAGGSTPPSTPATPPAFTRTFVFPPFGLANSKSAIENGRISVVNIAQNAHNGTKASCNGSISFTNGNGDPVGSPTAFTDLPTGQVFSADVIGASPSSSNIRPEFQGSVQVTLTAGSVAPCSLLLTLEVYDPMSGATHALVTSTVEAFSVEPATGGHSR